MNKIFVIFLGLMSLLGCRSSDEKKSFTYDPDGKVFQVPYQEKIAVDGLADDWKPGEFLEIELLSDLSGATYDSENFGATARLAWSNEGLAVFFDVRDDALVLQEGPDEILRGDAAEIFLSNVRGGKDMLQFIISPGFIEDEPGECGKVVWNTRGTRPLVGREIEISCATTKTKQGYALEMVIPFNNLGKTADEGVELGLQLSVSDVDSEEGKKTLVWHHMPNSYKTTWAAQRVQLAKKPGREVDYSVRSFVTDRETLTVKVIASGDWDDQQISVRDTSGVVGTFELDKKDGLFQGSAVFPFSCCKQTPVSVWNDNRLLGVIDPRIVKYDYPDTKQGPLEHEVRIFKMLDQKRMPEKGQILFIGHSLFRYWKTLEDDMKGLNVVNRAFGGSKITHVNYYFDQLVAPYKSEKIVVFEGSNDLNDPSVSGKDVFEECMTFVQKVKNELPETERVFFISHPVIKGWNEHKHERYKELNALLKEQSKTDSLVSLIDISGVLAEPGNRFEDQVLLPDHHHFNHRAYELLAPVIREQIEE